MSGDATRIPSYIGIGSNLDDPARQVRDAIAGLRELPDTTVQGVSSLYRNPPMGPPDQPDFVNAVVVLLTGLAPRTLLNELQDMERRHGRDRSGGERWGPRRIDLDILTYGSDTIAEPGLTIPHPGIPERNFVLFPLLEVAPDLDVPGHGPVRRLASMVDAATLERLGD